MSRTCTFACVMACLALLTPLQLFAAEGTQSGLVVRLIVLGDSGVYVGFATRPTDCAGEYRQTHAFLTKQSPDFTTFYAALSSAKATAVPVQITYAIAGDCTTAQGVLQLTGLR
jgi:hypothetical protein